MGLHRQKRKKFDALKVAKQINGYFLRDTTMETRHSREASWSPPSDAPVGRLHLRRNWIMSGSFTADGFNNMEKRGKDDPRVSGFTPTGPSAGRSTAGSSTTGLPAT
jgi:hypothetical protein